MPEQPGIAVAAAFSAACALLVAAILGLGAPSLLILVVAAISFACGRYAHSRAGFAGVLAMFAALAAGGDGVVPFLLCTAGPWIAGRVLRSREELLDTLEERKRELEAEQAALTRLSVSRERARIARELHDIVAHHLAVIVIQAGAGRIATDETGVTERFARIRRSGDEALEEMSLLVDMLQRDDQDRDQREWRLEALLVQAQAAGLKLRSEGLPMDVLLRPEVERLAYRVVQEGVTNAMKHAPGSEVRLRVAVEARAVEIELRNESGDDPTSLGGTGSGLGLEGLRERVELVGGRLDAGPEGEDGWCLYARVPTG